MDTSFLTKKYGPLSGWVYLVALAGLGVVLYMRKKNSNTTTANTTTTDTATGAVIDNPPGFANGGISTQGGFTPMPGTSNQVVARPINIGTLTRTIRTIDPNTVAAAQYFDTTRQPVIHAAGGGKQVLD